MENLSDADLERCIKLFDTDSVKDQQWKKEAELELMRRRLPHLAEIFPEGGYLEEDGLFVPFI